MSILNNKQNLTAACKASFCYADVLRWFNLAPLAGNFTRLKKFISKFEIDVTHFIGQSIPDKWKRENIEKAVAGSLNFSQALQAIGLSVHGDNMKTLKRYIALYKLDTSHFSKVRLRRVSVLTDDQIFCVNSHVDRSIVKRNILTRNLIEYKCRDCNNDGTWNDKSITLQLEHINGSNNDNRLENLTFLCPNCHSQTLTHGSKIRPT